MNKAARYQYERLFAQCMLMHFGLPNSALRLLKYSNTALYRVDAPQGRFVLRLHPPGRMTEAALRSELDWLATLRRETSLWVPEPVAGPDNQLLAIVPAPDQSDYRYGALFRWMPGYHKSRRLTSTDADRIGQCLGELHTFAATYTPPPNFTRWTFDWPAVAVLITQQPAYFTLAPTEMRLLEAAVALVDQALAQLNQNSDAFGLIHGDTNLSNVRFHGTRVGLLDFEVCCFGPYLFDVTRTLLEFAQTGSEAAALERAFHQGYRFFRALPALDDPIITAFKLMNIIDVIAWILHWDERMPRHTGPERIKHALEQVTALIKRS